MRKILAACVALMLIFGVVALADESTLVVSGAGTVYMEANQVSATMGFTITGDDLAQLQRQANETVAAICASLKQAGLDEKSISTNYIYMTPRYDYSGETEKIVGYSINNSLSIITDEIDKIGTYIDAAFAAGANTFDSISFGAKNNAEARMQALQLAVEDARVKAEVIAAASGKSLGEVIEICEDSQDYYNNNSASGGVRYAITESVAADVGTTVRASQVQVSARVDITYELK